MQIETKSGVMEDHLQITIRPGNLGDLEEIVDMGHLFFEESNFRDLTYDPLRFKEIIRPAMENGEIFFDVAVCKGRIVAYHIWALERYYTIEYTASVFLLYIHPKFRGKGVDRALVSASVERAKEEGAAVFYSASTAGITSRVDRKMENMLEKQGFELLGKFARKVL